MSRFVIVGGGHAAGQAAASLRHKGFDGELIVLGNESFPPYQRPPLSKAYLNGDEALEHLFVRQPAFYEKQNIDVRTSVNVEAVHADNAMLQTSDGDLGYDKLLLAVGGRPRRLDVPGSDLNGIHYLRTIRDVDRIREDMQSAQNVCIVGGGYIGLEVAAAAIKAGKQVTVLETEDRVLQRVATPELSAFYHDVHVQHGVNIRVHSQVTGFDGDGRVLKVLCGDSDVAAELVVIGIGILPNIELAEAAGLECNNGIVVDEYCRTSHPDIYAAGDCSNHPSPQLGRRLRLESVPNALDQAKVAAANMLGGHEIHDSVPWFWSDQYDLKLQMVGFSGDGDTQILRGDMRQREFAIFHLRGDTVVAVDAVNQPREFMVGKKLFGKQVDKTSLADPGIETRLLLDNQGDR